MGSTVTRRSFVQMLGGAVAIRGIVPFRDGAAASSPRTKSETARDKYILDEELRKRARSQLQQRRLCVDYYRVGRRIAYPLPVRGLSFPDVEIPGISQYPWATWLLWALEERLFALGWAAEWFQDGGARDAASADLDALVAWPEYRQLPQPDLSSAHAGRLLWTAATRWSWVQDGLRGRLAEACRRHAESVLSVSDKLFGRVNNKNDVLSLPTPHSLLHNIPLIGTIGAALTAQVARHPSAALLNARVHALFGAILDLREKGFSEGVAYDGYVLDFLADWLDSLPEQDRRPILDHPRLNDYWDESYMLGAPGAAENVAELSDVEPKQMPFHLSAQAKLLCLRPQAARVWFLERCSLDVCRTDCLAALRRSESRPTPEPPACGASDAHYAAVLRSGWEPEDLAVAVSCTTSPMSHIQIDNGTLLIGTQRDWLITDPGYQQYVKGDEREFTVGRTAHNAPLINGAAQTQKRARRIALETVVPRAVHRLVVDLTACYPSSASVKAVVRHVWLYQNHLVVVADCVDAAKRPRLEYHWHGHPDAAWWFEDRWALVAMRTSQLWFGSPQTPVAGANLRRLPGSRGPLTLVTSTESAPEVVWWVFALGEQPPTLQLDASARQILVNSSRGQQRFQIPVGLEGRL